MPTVEDIVEDIPELYLETEDDSSDEEDETDNAPSTYSASSTNSENSSI
jgi:hypothetical protein